MSKTIRSDPTDDPQFIAIVERIATRLFKWGDYEEVYIVEIKNWFDHKWLKFSGIGRVPFHHIRDSQPQVALDEFWQQKITFPPFTPNRILRQQWHPADPSKPTRSKFYPYRSDRRQHSCWNLQNRVSQYASSALFIWFSSGTRNNDRGSVMVYTVRDGGVSGWYASFRKAGQWVLDRSKEVSRDEIASLVAEDAEPDAAPNAAPAHR